MAEVKKEKKSKKVSVKKTTISESEHLKPQYEVKRFLRDKAGILTKVEEEVKVDKDKGFTFVKFFTQKGNNKRKITIKKDANGLIVNVDGKEQKMDVDKFEKILKEYDELKFAVDYFREQAGGVRRKIRSKSKSRKKKSKKNSKRMKIIKKLK